MKRKRAPASTTDNLSVIRQKSESQTGIARKQSTPNFPKNEYFLPFDTHTIKGKFMKHMFSSHHVVIQIFRSLCQRNYISQFIVR